jgi:hypothetical protein
MRIIYLLIIVTISLCGCSKNIGTLSYISNREIRDDAHKAEKIGSNITGEDVHWYVLIYPFFSWPRLDLAVDDALAKTGGDYMSNVTVSNTWFFIPALCYRHSLKVVGDVWKNKSEVQGVKQ